MVYGFNQENHILTYIRNTKMTTEHFTFSQKNKIVKETKEKYRARKGASTKEEKTDERKGKRGKGLEVEMGC